MFAKLWGIVDDMNETSLVVRVQGVGYLVSCARTTLARLRQGLAVTLYIETDMREGAIQLFGFLDPAERHWYRLLHSVQGVGGRAALALLSGLTVKQLARAILSGDKTRLTCAEGVGPKIAARILTELKEKAAVAPQDLQGSFEICEDTNVRQRDSQKTDRLSDNGLTPEKKKPTMSGYIEDAVSALENLGYNRSQAYGAVLDVEAELTEEDIDLAVLIRHSLQKLSETFNG